MNRLLVCAVLLPLLVGCESLRQSTQSDMRHSQLEYTTRAPFEEMVNNAQQPSDVLGTIYFEFDKAGLSEESKEFLNQIAREISKRQGLVVVEGHTDHINSETFNKRLGYKRSIVVIDYLKSAGVWDERLLARSYGEHRPTANNTLDLGRGLNRRVVIKMFAQGEGMSAAEASATAIKLRGETLSPTSGPTQ